MLGRAPLIHGSRSLVYFSVIGIVSDAANEGVFAWVGFSGSLFLPEADKNDL